MHTGTKLNFGIKFTAEMTAEAASPRQYIPNSVVKAYYLHMNILGASRPSETRLAAKLIPQRRVYASNSNFPLCFQPLQDSKEPRHLSSWLVSRPRNRISRQPYWLQEFDRRSGRYTTIFIAARFVKSRVSDQVGGQKW